MLLSQRAHLLRLPLRQIAVSTIIHCSGTCNNNNNTTTTNNKTDRIDDIALTYKRWERYFDQADPWELKHGMNLIRNHNMLLTSELSCSMLRACKRHNDDELATKVLLLIKNKVPDELEYKILMEKCRPTMDLLGIGATRGIKGK